MGLVLLDMDGTIRRAKSGATFINNPSDQELIPGAMQAMKDVALIGGHHMIGVTNQRGVAAGFKSLADCIREQRQTIALSRELLDAIVFCPDDGASAWIVWADDDEPGSTGLSYHGDDWVPDGATVKALQKSFGHGAECTVFQFQGVTTPHTSGYYRKPKGGMAQLAHLYYCEVLIDDPMHETVNPTPVLGPMALIQPPLAQKHLPLLMVGDMDSDKKMADSMGIPYRDASDWLLNPLP